MTTLRDGVLIELFQMPDAWDVVIERFCQCLDRASQSRKVPTVGARC